TVAQADCRHERDDREPTDQLVCWEIAVFPGHLQASSDCANTAGTNQVTRRSRTEVRQSGCKRAGILGFGRKSAKVARVSRSCHPPSGSGLYLFISNGIR